MSELYALPDHEVIESLIPGIKNNFLTDAAAVELIRTKPGLVPVAINPAGSGSVYFADLGDYPYREWQFMYTVSRLAECGQIGQSFQTDLAVLRHKDLLGSFVEPSGFIFHISRCGSTLTGKALARIPNHVVINQGGPLQRGFWAVITQEWQQPAVPTGDVLTMLRNLIYLMARPRQAQQNTSFVKFISWNTLYMDLIQTAFPTVPCLFLYRNPVEVIASVFRETTAVLWAKDHAPAQAAFLTSTAANTVSAMDPVLFLAKCYARYFRQALGAPNNLSVLNYLHLSRSSFPDILLRGLDLRPEVEAVSQMLEQFDFHAKDDTNSAKFVNDSAAKRGALPQQAKDMIDRECGELVAQLDRAAHNLFAAAN